MSSVTSRSCRSCRSCTRLAILMKAAHCDGSWSQRCVRLQGLSHQCVDVQLRDLTERSDFLV